MTLEGLSCCSLWTDFPRAINFVYKELVLQCYVDLREKDTVAAGVTAGRLSVRPAIGSRDATMLAHQINEVVRITTEEGDDDLMLVYPIRSVSMHTASNPGRGA